MIYEKTNSRPVLFCKPAPGERNFLFEKDVASLNGAIRFRSFDLQNDLHTVHKWVNMPYARQFWQMRGSLALYRSCYQCIQQSPDAHSFVGYFNDQPVCQFDIYRVTADELATHVEHTEDDCGFHLLMAPNQQPVHGLTQAVIEAFLNYFFSLPRASGMYAEPDSGNLRSIRLLQNAGFTAIKTISMSYKTAQVFYLTKEIFMAAQQH